MEARSLLPFVFLLSTAPAFAGDGLIVQTVLGQSSAKVIGVPVVSGNTVAVSASNFEVGGGSTVIYEKSTAGTWAETQTLAGGAPDAISGSTLVLGDQSSQVFTMNPARVYVSDASGNWSQQATLSGTDATACDQYGAAVAVSGDVAIVGAPYHGGGAPDPDCAGGGKGGVYVFERDAGGDWSQVQELLPAAPAAGHSISNFGWRVALSGTTLLVDALVDSVGQTYVYSQQGNGSWQLQAVLPGPGLSRGFGVAGDMIAVSPQTSTDEVQTYAAPQSGSNWGLTASLQGNSDGVYGSYLAISGKLLMVVATLEASACSTAISADGSSNCTSMDTPGGLYAYSSSGSSWQSMAVYAPTTMQSVNMEDTVASDGETVVADGSLQDADGSTDTGIFVMQVGNAPTRGYSVVSPGSGSILPEAGGGSTDSMSASSSGGSGSIGLVWELLLLGVCWSGRQKR